MDQVVNDFFLALVTDNNCQIYHGNIVFVIYWYREVYNQSLVKELNLRKIFSLLKRNYETKNCLFFISLTFCIDNPELL